MQPDPLSSKRDLAPAPDPLGTCSRVEGWELTEYAVVSSTNSLAASLPAWAAIRADTQTAGRGRFDRAWVSDAGGLWLSAAVPLGAESSSRQVLPLVCGLAGCEALQGLGVNRLRIRWPNDLLADDRKVAGILVDQYRPDVAVVGIGINVTNHPERHDAALTQCATRLADLLPSAPDLSSLAAVVLRHLRARVLDLNRGGFEALLPFINPLWGPPRAIAVELETGRRTGRFMGVDREGRIAFASERGSIEHFPAHQVRHLAEI